MFWRVWLGVSVFLLDLFMENRHGHLNGINEREREEQRDKLTTEYENEQRPESKGI
jgi:hypothetical protein